MAEHYRKVHTKLWADARFASLSDAGKLVWMLLLTAPSMSPIPGVITASEHELAHMLGWSVEGYRKGYGEVLGKGFEVASEGRLVWVKKALQYQAPESINNAKFWRHGWAEIPECQLKRDIWIAIKSTCLEWWEALAVGFPEPLPKGLPKGYAKPFETHSDSDSDSEDDQQKDRDVRFARGTVVRDNPVKPPRNKRIAKTWEPNDESRAHAAELQLDCAFEATEFRNYWLGRGKPMADWDALFQSRLTSQSKFHKGRKPSNDGMAELFAMAAEKSP